MENGTIVTLLPVTKDMRERFILDNQRAYKIAAIEGMEGGGESEGEIIERFVIEETLDDENCDSFMIMADGKYAGGMIVKINRETMKNSLELFYVCPEGQGRGVGFGAWREIEKNVSRNRVVGNGHALF